MFELTNISKEFGQVKAVDRVSLRIKKAERVAFIGPSGAGKTTLFRIINCTIPSTTGSLAIDGIDVSKLKQSQIKKLRCRIGMVFQHHNLINRLPVIHNVISGKLGYWSAGKSLLSLLHPIEFEEAKEALEKVGIADKIFSRPLELSGGQRQRVSLARVLFQDPDAIIADEPVSSVDQKLAQEIIELIIDISNDNGKTLLVSLHSVDLALKYFPRIIGFSEGKIIFDSSPDKVSKFMLEALFSKEEFIREELNSEEYKSASLLHPL